MRPDVALAFDRMEGAASADGVTLDDHQRLPLRRRAGRAVGPPPGPEVGRAPRHVAAPQRHGARPRPAGGLRLARRERPPLPLHPALRVGALAFRLRAEPGSSRPAARRAAATGEGGAGCRTARCPGSCPSASRRCCGPRRSAGTSPRSCSPRSSTPSPASTRSRSPSGRAGHRAVHARDGAAMGLTNPFDPEQAIDAQARLMRDLLRQFGSVPLALAAYNAGPGPCRGLRVRPEQPGDARLRRPDPRADVRRGRPIPLGTAARWRCALSGERAPSVCSITPASRRPASSSSASARMRERSRISWWPSSPT